jgi:Tol biopolymer transport system component
MPRIADVLERESRSVDLELGDFERLLGRRERRHRNQRIRAGALGVVIALAVGIVLVRSLTSNHIPVDEPTPAPAPAPGVSGALAYALDGDIYLADPDGSNAVKIAAPDEGCGETLGSSAPSWSPDGKYLAFQRDCYSVDRAGTVISDRSAVVITDPDGTVVAEFPNFPPAGGFEWSPDSTRIAEWGDLQRTVDIYGLDGVRRASLPSPLTGSAAESAPEWMPDGSALLVLGAEPPSLMALPIDGSPAHELPYGLRVASPDGTRVAVFQDGAVAITDADGAPVSGVDTPLRGAVWSPDGNRFASVSRRGDVVVVDAASGKVTVLPEARQALSEGEYVNTVRGFSPQGDRILYAALVRDGGAFYNDLYSISVDGSDARQLVVGAMQGQWRPR